MTDADLLPEPDLLDLDLEGPAGALGVPRGDVRAVIARGRHRQRRRRAGGAILATLVVVSAGTVALGGTDDDGGTPVRMADGGARRGAVAMDWEVVDPASGLGFSRDLGGELDGSPLYALSTAAGTVDVGSATPKRVVWRSDDGIEWTAARTLGTDLYLSDLSTAGSRVYAVGTAAATADGGTRTTPVFVGWSDDGAATWQRAGLDLDLAAIGAVSRRLDVTASDVVSSDAGTVAVVVLSAALDISKVLPDGVTAPHGWARTEEGVDLLASDEPSCDSGEKPVPTTEPAAEAFGVACKGRGGVVTPQEAYGVRASYTWAELGVAGDVLRAVRRQPVAFFAEPGSTEFRRVELASDAPAYDVLLEAVDGGFDLAVSGPVADDHERSEVRFQHADDGRTWTPSTAVTGVEWVAAVGRVDGRPTVIGYGRDGGGRIVRSNGDGTWSSTEVADLLDDPPADGAVAMLSAADIGPLGAVVATPTRVLVSRDGTTWSDVAAADLVGEGRRVRSVSRVVVSGDQALVTVSLVAPDGDRPLQAVVRGRPA
jgi:hypothetical protein